jgi:hypothetical protein
VQVCAAGTGHRATSQAGGRGSATTTIKVRFIAEFTA